MSAFREHFLDKYFGYRRFYVARVAELAPHRRGLAIVSEIARLGFVLVTCALVAFLMSIVFIRALASGSWWNVVYFGIILGMALAFGVLTIGGLRDALLARSATEPRAGA
jgi:polyferredoxin